MNRVERGDRRVGVVDHVREERDREDLADPRGDEQRDDELVQRDDDREEQRREEPGAQAAA